MNTTPGEQAAQAWAQTSERKPAVLARKHMSFGKGGHLDGAADRCENLGRGQRQYGIRLYPAPIGNARGENPEGTPSGYRISPRFSGE
ncbi:hypothetical protein ACFOEY_05760 [Paracandidimonas soli]